MEEKKDIVCVDTETGGFSATKNGLCSITMKVVGKDIIETIFIKPNKYLYYSPQAMEINGLTLEFLEKNGVSEKDAVVKIINFFYDNFNNIPAILGHNIAFDIRFLIAAFERHSQLFEPIYLGTKDTMGAMRRLKTQAPIEIENVKLNTCYNYFFGTDIVNAHTSEGDVIATEKIYHKIEEILEKI